MIQEEMARAFVEQYKQMPPEMKGAVATAIMEALAAALEGEAKRRGEYETERRALEESAGFNRNTAHQLIGRFDELIELLKAKAAPLP